MSDRIKELESSYQAAQAEVNVADQANAEALRTLKAALDRKREIGKELDDECKRVRAEARTKEA